MAKAGSIVVSLIARTEAFTRGMSRSQRSLKALEAATARSMLMLKRFAFVAAGAALAGLTLLTKKSMKNIDAVAKLSDRLGVSTEFLIAYGHAASIAGSNQEAFNKSIEMFVRRLGEVKQGTGEAKYGLEALSLTADQLIAMGPEEAFIAVANGIKGLKSQAEKAAVAYRFFGRQGSQLLNLLESDLSGVMDEAKRLNLLVSRDMARRIEQANDAIRNMKGAFEGIGNTLAIAISPYITAIADKITDMSSGSVGLKKVEDIFKKIVYGATYLHDIFLGIKGVVNGIVGLFQIMISYNLKNINLLVKAAKLISYVLGGIGSEFIESISAGIEDMAKEFEDAGKRNLGEAGDDFLAIGKSRQALDEFYKRMENQKFEPKPNIPGVTPEDVEDIGTSKEKEATAREIDTSLVSIAGLNVGKENRFEMRMISQLEQIARNTRKSANMEILN